MHVSVRVCSHSLCTLYATILSQMQLSGISISRSSRDGLVIKTAACWLPRHMGTYVLNSAPRWLNGCHSNADSQLQLHESGKPPVGGHESGKPSVGGQIKL